MENINQMKLEKLPKLEPFITSKQIIESGLFPDLTEDKIRHYVRQGSIRAYGPGKEKTYLLSEVYEDWKRIGRKVDGYFKVPQGSQKMGSGLPKAWRKA